MASVERLQELGVEPIKLKQKEKPKCIKCGRVCQHKGEYRIDGTPMYRKTCAKCHGIKYGMGGWEYKKYRKTYCENSDGRLGYICTSTIIDPDWQLDADHIDGNHSNNSKENIQTLCACCHRIKTKMDKDFELMVVNE